MLLLMDEKQKKEVISFDLETILIKELIDYKLYQFADLFEEYPEGYDGENLTAGINALKMVLAKYLNIFGDELELYLNQRIFGLMQFGYTPPVYICAVVVDLYVQELYEKLLQQPA